MRDGAVLGCASSRGSDRAGSRPGEARGGGKLGRARLGERHGVVCTLVLSSSALFDAFSTWPEVGDGSDKPRKTSGVGGSSRKTPAMAGRRRATREREVCTSRPS